ncbi:hypothetical protein D3C71_1794990 [compost metagenome]
MCANGFGRFLHLPVGGFQPPETDIVPNRAREDERILEHDSDLAAQTHQRNVPDIQVVDGNAAS